jgi:predicted DNA-binding protein with PD1-like motif
VDRCKVKNVSQTESRTGRTIFARLSENEDLLNAIKEKAEQNGIQSGFFFLIGTVKRAVMGYYKEGNYKQIKVAGPLEIVSCKGNVSLREDGELVAHAHISVADEEGRMFGGHLLPGCPIDATGELVLIETPEAKMKRVLEKKLNLYLWHLGE